MERDCENCKHKGNIGCTVWECKFEPKESDPRVAFYDYAEAHNLVVWSQESTDYALKAIKKLDKITEIINAPAYIPQEDVLRYQMIKEVLEDGNDD